MRKKLVPDSPIGNQRVFGSNCGELVIRPEAIAADSNQAIGVARYPASSMAAMIRC